LTRLHLPCILGSKAASNAGSRHVFPGFFAECKEHVVTIELKRVPVPPHGFAGDLPSLAPSEYELRLEALYQAAGSDWVAVYADREHQANLTYLIHFDPRFEEALLVLGPRQQRVLITGNEGLGYTSVVPIPVQVVLCQTFSLPGQRRDEAPSLFKVLQDLGLQAGDRISVVGWKYLLPEEWDAPQSPAFVPAFLVDVLRKLVGPQGSVTDGTAVMMDPQNGLRAKNTVDQIAAFEWAARNCSAAVFNVLLGARPGMSEYEVVQKMGYAGQPLTMHPIFVSGKGEINGLRSPSAKTVEYGDAVSIAVGYWGSLACRAGLMLGQPDTSFLEQVITPYYRAIAAWYKTMRIGVQGGEVHQAVVGAFEGSPYRSALNPGHLTSYEEWMHSPIRPDSHERIRSGMVFQCDIIPVPLDHGQLLNCEDTVAVADADLRAELRSAYPAMWSRMQQRRELMTEGLGLELGEELLPLSDGAGYLPPFWLAADYVCAVTG
jgi:hypothetical protein